MARKTATKAEILGKAQQYRKHILHNLTRCHALMVENGVRVPLFLGGLGGDEDILTYQLAQKDVRDSFFKASQVVQKVEDHGEEG